jgi:hypothetical protein
MFEFLLIFYDGIECQLFMLIAFFTPAKTLLASKAVNRGDKRTRRLRGRGLALRENHRRFRGRVITLQEKARRCLSPALRENHRRGRVLDRWSEARDSSVGIVVLGPRSKERERECLLMGHEPRTMNRNGTY